LFYSPEAKASIHRRNAVEERSEGHHGAALHFRPSAQTNGQAILSVITAPPPSGGRSLQHAPDRRPWGSDATFYTWRTKYGGMEVSDARKLKALEDENRKLKNRRGEQRLGRGRLLRN
jgi:hypothetical protein